MGRRKFRDYIPDACHRRYSCVHCRAHLANHDELISKVSLLRGTLLMCVSILCRLVRSLFKVAKERPTSSTKCEFDDHSRPRQCPITNLILSMQGEYWLWQGRGENTIDRASRSCRHLLQQLQNNPWLEICEHLCQVKHQCSCCNTVLHCLLFHGWFECYILFLD